MKTSKRLLASTPILLEMLMPHHIEFVLDKLEAVLTAGIDGEVLELGCHAGSTSIFIRKLLNELASQKDLHVYDSFQGLPEKSQYDDLSLLHYQKGDCSCPKEALVKVFHGYGLKEPVINEGWFADIPDDRYPKKICFAFLDSDFYSSILDSLQKIYDKLEPGAIVCVHDYRWEKLPGVEKACLAFLEHRPERMQQEVEGVGFFEKQ